MSDAEFPITIYHNPACGTSRNALAMIRAAGYDPHVVEYLKEGWSRALIDALLSDMNMTPRALMREKGTPAAELELTDPAATDDAIVDAMLAHPILVNRPIVVTPLGTKLCRPSEVVLALLERKPDHFIKEDGGAAPLTHPTRTAGGLATADETAPRRSMIPFDREARLRAVALYRNMAGSPKSGSGFQSAWTGAM